MDLVEASHDITVTGYYPNNYSYIFLTAVLAAIVIRRIQQPKHFKHNEKITRLPSFPIVGAIHLLAKVARDPAGTLQYYSTKYGSTVFETTIFGKSHVYITNPAYLKKLLLSNEPGHLTKPKLIYEAVFTGIAKDGLVASTNIPEWRIHRNILSKAFTYSALASYFDIFNKRAMDLVREMKANAEESIYRRLHVTTSRIITEILVGENNLTEHDYSEILDEIEKVKAIYIYKFYRPWFFLNFFWKLHPKSLTLKTTLKKLEDILMNAINRYTEKQTQNSEAIPDNKICAMKLLVNAGLSRREIVSEIATGYVAGHDTTSLSIQMLLYNLAKHPKYQNLCRVEISRVLSGSNQVTMTHVSEMKYLEQCVKESLRLYPIGPMFERELQSDLELDEDLTIKTGSYVRVPVWMIHRNPELYPNPEVFDPDRFLPEVLATKSQFEFLPFSHGPRVCLGWKMAMFQIKLTVAHLLQNFEFYIHTEAILKAEQALRKIWPIDDVGVKFRTLKDS